MANLLSALQARYSQAFLLAARKKSVMDELWSLKNSPDMNVMASSLSTEAK